MKSGLIKSGLVHWKKHGHSENRPLRKRAYSRSSINEQETVFSYSAEPEAEVQTSKRLLREFLNVSTELVESLRLPKKQRIRNVFPTADLSQSTEDGKWTSVSRDPKWFIPISLAAGYVRIQFAAEIKDVMSPLQCGKWQIYFGRGFHETESFAHYFRGGHILCDCFIFVPRRVKVLRVDPVDFACEFTVTTFVITQWPRLEGLAISARKRWRQLGERGTRAATLCAAILSLVSAKPRNAVRLLTRYEPLSIIDPYQHWVESRRVDQRLRAKFKEQAKSFEYQPKISIIMPAYKSHLAYLQIAIESVRSQTYENWELCIVDDGSGQPPLTAMLTAYSKLDGRIKVQTLSKNLGISGASNAALAMATGDFIALLDHDDELAPHALHAFVNAMQTNPDADWLYSDEDKIDEAGKRTAPLFKPWWSPAFFLSCMYTCHLGVYRREMAIALGGFRPEFDLAQDYDLALRFAGKTTKIVHVPDVLYHWRTLPESTASGAQAKPTAAGAARRAVRDFIKRSGLEGDVLDGPFDGSHRPQFKIKGNPLVSIVIPSAGRKVDDGRHFYVSDLVMSIRERTTYNNVEIIVIENDDFDPVLRENLDNLGVRRELYKSDTFNFSEKMNFGVRQTTGQYIIVLNDDMRVISQDWIESMLSWCQQPDVAAVGAKLLFPDEIVQHAGVVLLQQGPDFVPSHILYGRPRDEVGLAGSGVVAREYLAVTAACLMVRRSDYLAIGGFDPFFRVNYNDVDFCLRLREYTRGRIICDPYAMLYHFESASKEEPPGHELADFNQRWKHICGNDPFYNIHLSQWSTNWEINPAVLSLEEQYNLQ